MPWSSATRPRSDASTSIEEAEELCAPFEHTTDDDPAKRRITERLSHARIPVVLLERDIALAAFSAMRECIANPMLPARGLLLPQKN